MTSLDATVFIVDDDPETQSSFAALIGSLGLNVEAFGSGEEFLRAAAPERTGCAIVDYRLAGMDGMEVYRQLKGSGRFLPVLLVSAYLDVRTVAHALREGVLRVIEKPYSNDELIGAVREAVEYDAASRRQRRFRIDFEHRLETLDARERFTLDYILAGKSNKAIENRLHVSRRTIERIRSSILEKMNSLSFVELSVVVGEAKASGAFRPHFAASGVAAAHGLSAVAHAAPEFPVMAMPREMASGDFANYI